jgi:CDP-glycerol glycerophosphotransferase (TagB/SpsB family)
LKATQLGDRGGVISQHQKYRSNPLTRALYLEFLKKPDAVITTSDFMQKQFGLDQMQCHKLGYPRLDVGADLILLKLAKAANPSPDVESAFGEYAEIYMYMPTFRDSGRPFLEQAFPSMRSLSDALSSRNALMYIKLHPRTSAEISKDFSNIRAWPDGIDFYPFLYRFDAIITDYSSILYDYIFQKNAGVILYTFDFNEYQEADRNLLYPFDENVVGIRVNNFDELCTCLSEGRALAPLPADELGKIRERFWGSCTAPVSATVVKGIEALL